MNAMLLNKQMFVSALAKMAKTVELAGENQRFSCEHVKPFLKTLVGHSRQQKVMALAWKLYKGSRMRGQTFDRKRFALYVACAHSEVSHENAPPKTFRCKKSALSGLIVPANRKDRMRPRNQKHNIT